MPVGLLDVAFYRDDIGIRPVLPEAATDIPGDLAGQLVVLVDDVLFTGRTVRAALNALADYGRARAVQLAVMVDRGHRELPIRPDFVGKNMPTRIDEQVDVSLDGVVLGRRGAPMTPADEAPRAGREAGTCSRSPSSAPRGSRRSCGCPTPSSRSAGGSIPKVPALRGRTVVTLFAEQSTRTRLSFETAAKRLSADVLSFSVDTSSVKKGESLRDTVETVAAMGVDAFVVRHTVGRRARRGGTVGRRIGGQRRRRLARAPHPGAARLLHDPPGPGRARRAPARATPGWTCFVGLRVAIVGDVRHSRVARSLVLALGALGAEVTLVAPGSLLPPSLEGWPVSKVSYDLDAVLPHVDVCYLLRLQSERGAGRLPALGARVQRRGTGSRRGGPPCWATTPS